MKTKTLIEKQLQRKTNSDLVNTVISAKKAKAWNEVAGLISGPRRQRVDVNLNKINNEAKDGETIVVPGKVLSIGEIDKKINVVALSFSEKAKERLLKAGSKVSSIAEEIKSNPEAKDIKVLRK